MCQSTPERRAENYPHNYSRENCEIRRAFALAHPVHGDPAGDTPVMIDRRSLLVAVPPGAVATGCGDTRSAAPPPPPIVKAEPVVERDVPISAEWVGTLVGNISAQIRPRISGHLISQNYPEGAPVVTGDLLPEVDPRLCQVALDQAEAQLLQAESQLSQATAQVSTSQAQVEQALAKVAQGEAEVTKTAADQRRTDLDVARDTPLAQRGVNMPTDDGGQRCTSWR